MVLQQPGAGVQDDREDGTYVGAGANKSVFASEMSCLEPSTSLWSHCWL